MSLVPYEDIDSMKPKKLDSPSKKSYLGFGFFTEIQKYVLFPIT